MKFRSTGNATPATTNGDLLVSKIGLIAGPILAITVIGTLDLDPTEPNVTRTAGVALLMAVWWITEALPLSATALLPLVLFPLLGIMDGKTVASQYCNHIVFLFIGGFMVALAMERWNLHKRIALGILRFFGGGPRRTLLGLMIATAFLSMWISNTAASMMMVTIVLAIIIELEARWGKPAVQRYSTAIFLGVAYSASIGGIATLVGTPTNMSFSRIFQILFPTPQAPDLSFVNWFAFALPITALLLVTSWAILSLLHIPRGMVWVRDREMLGRQAKELGSMSFAESIVLIDFLLLVLLWVFRADIQIGNFKISGWSNWFPNPDYINDGTVAITMALILFLIPTLHQPKTRVLDWSTASRLPWDIVLLFGGGFALAVGFQESGLTSWLGNQLSGAGSLPPYVLLTIVCLTITFVTELTSNTATAEMILPLMAALAVAIDVNPLFLMMPVTLSCSCAFMMPVATPPNAIVFGTDRLRVADMVRSGIALNLVGTLLIVLAMYLLGGPLWQINIHQMPDWAGAHHEQPIQEP